MLKILVTGGSGRIGQYVLDLLAKANHEVANYDLVPSKVDEYAFIKGDLRDRNSLKNVTKGLDAIIHLAGYWGERAIPNYWDGWDVNIGGTFNVLQAAIENKIAKIVYASSICSTGIITWAGPIHALEYFPVDEQHPFRGQDLYSTGKAIGEQLCYMYCAKYGITAMCLRFTTVWFPSKHIPKEQRSSPVYEMIQKPETALERPLAFRDLCWQYGGVRDIAESCKLAVESELKGYRPYNIGAADTPTDWTSLQLAEFLYPGVKIHTPELFISNPKRALWDISKAQRELGYRPKDSWKTYLQEYLS